MRQTVSGAFAGEAKKQTMSAKFDPVALAACFPLPWSAYVRLLSVKNASARKFYERRYSWETLNGEVLNGGRCRTRTCDTLRVRQETENHKDNYCNNLRHTKENGCTECCTAFPEEMKAAKAVLDLIQALPDAERQAILASLGGNGGKES